MRSVRKLTKDPGTGGSATELVVAGLRNEIDDGPLEPGLALRQDELAARFGTSRIPVREALRTLQAEGLVTYSANRGATVTLVPDPEIHEMLEVRIALECHAIRLSIPNFVEDDAKAARTVLTQYDAAHVLKSHIQGTQRLIRARGRNR